jgi:hypothetical protein
MGFAGHLRAQEGPPPIPDQAKKLQQFVGTWEGTGSMNMGEMKHEMKITHISEPTADGWGVSNTEINETEGMETYRCINIFGYDAGSDQTHLYSVSNYGDCHDHMGKWADENTLRLRYDGVWDGKPIKETITIAFDSPEQYRFTVTKQVGGEHMFTIDGIMTKK